MHNTDEKGGNSILQYSRGPVDAAGLTGFTEKTNTSISPSRQGLQSKSTLQALDKLRAKALRQSQLQSINRKYPMRQSPSHSSQLRQPSVRNQQSVLIKSTRTPVKP